MKLGGMLIKDALYAEVVYGKRRGRTRGYNLLRKPAL